MRREPDPLLVASIAHHCMIKHDHRARAVAQKAEEVGYEGDFHGCGQNPHRYWLDALL